MTSSPLRPGASLTDELNYYKKQYEQLETDLADFQASSKELEEQLEKDIDAAEKNERKLKEQIEKLRFDSEEWKSKHNQAKTESNNAQTGLQKEITSMREQNRSLQMKLRDIEVANDDFERQARNTTSSLEDLESRLNVSIERGVLLEEEIKNGETERESLRIENQRLRDELGDLKVESEITLEKLRLSGKTIEQLRTRKPGSLAVQQLRASSPASEASGVTGTSPTMSTPPPKSDTTAEVPTPPSPPLSDEATSRADPKTPLPSTKRYVVPDTAATPRPFANGRVPAARHARGASVASASTHTTDSKRTVPMTKVVSPANTSARLPRSESLYQMKSLRVRMQKIEERVQSARSKLPAPRDTTPKASPRSGLASNNQIPSSVTVRRTSKRTSTATSSVTEDTSTDATNRRESQSHVKRLSYGIPRPMSRQSAAGDRPASQLSHHDRPPSAASRPASRVSLAASTNRAGSRASLHDDHSRPRSSMSGAHSSIPATPRTHRPSASISELRRRAAEGDDTRQSITGNRRSTMDKGSILPTTSSLARRQSNGFIKNDTIGRRTSVTAIRNGAMKPPAPKPKIRQVTDEQLDESELGETY